jgi:SAM-dependent methyltransferase
MAGMHLGDSWNRGDPYERYVGRWSQLVAHDFLDWLALPPALRWLDVGCGTGALTAAVREQCRPVRLTGIDPSDGFLQRARARLEGHATFHVASALELPLHDSEVDVVVSGLALNFFPDPARGLQEMQRVTTLGGTIAVYVWDYAGKMEFMRHFWDAAVELSSAARELDEGRRFPLCRPEDLENLFLAASLSDIEVRAIDIPTRFADFDDFWLPFLGGQGPAPSYAMSLDEAPRNRLRDRIHQRLPIESDGSIPLIARAWAIKGRRYRATV